MTGMVAIPDRSIPAADAAARQARDAAASGPPAGEGDGGNAEFPDLLQRLVKKDEPALAGQSGEKPSANLAAKGDALQRWQQRIDALAAQAGEDAPEATDGPLPERRKAEDKGKDAGLSLDADVTLPTDAPAADVKAQSAQPPQTVTTPAPSVPPVAAAVVPPAMVAAAAAAQSTQSAPAVSKSDKGSAAAPVTTQAEERAGPGASEPAAPDGSAPAVPAATMPGKASERASLAASTDAPDARDPSLPLRKDSAPKPAPSPSATAVSAEAKVATPDPAPGPAPADKPADIAIPKIQVLKTETHLAPVAHAWPAQQIADQVSAALSSPDAGEPQSTAASSPAQPAAFSGPVKVLHIQLQPMDLGTVTVRMSLKDDVISLEIVAQRHETAMLVDKDRDVLAHVLKSAGYGVDGLAVQVAPVDRSAAAIQPAAAPDARSFLQSSTQSHTGGGQPDGRWGGARQNSGQEGGHAGLPDGRAAPVTPSAPGQGLYV